MQITTHIKHLLLFLLTFLFGVQTTHAKTELVLPQNQVVFSVEQTPKVSTLKKEVQPNVGFLKEKSKFVTVQHNSAVNSYNFSEVNREGLANAGGGLIDDALSAILKSHPNFSKLGLSVSELDEFKLLLNSKMPNSASDIFGGLKSHLDAGTSFENMQQMISVAITVQTVPPISVLQCQ